MSAEVKAEPAAEDAPLGAPVAPPEAGRDMRELFSLFDKDGDGHIDAGELVEVMASLGVQLPLERAQDMIGQVDLDGNATLEFDEFVAMMETQVKDTNDEEDEMRISFEHFDKNKDGHITGSELRQGLLQLGEEVTDAEMHEMLAGDGADENADGTIDFEEFKTILSKWG